MRTFQEFLVGGKNRVPAEKGGGGIGGGRDNSEKKVSRLLGPGKKGETTGKPGPKKKKQKPIPPKEGLLQRREGNPGGEAVLLRA